MVLCDWVEKGVESEFVYDLDIVIECFCFCIVDVVLGYVYFELVIVFE